MKVWLHLAQHLRQTGRLVLVSVAGTQGSAPREAGAAMLVGLDWTEDTIGGGHLEWEAIAHARAMLLQTQPPIPDLQRYALGANLGQCCGGVVWLSYELIDPARAEEWAAHAQALYQGQTLQRSLSLGMPHSHWHTTSQPGLTRLNRDSGTWECMHSISDDSLPISVYGAGHVGRALVKLLNDLSLRVRWLDCRADTLQDCPPDVHPVVNEFLQDEVMTAPSNSYHIVMTHSHALDLEICLQVLRRPDIAWCGLIGSATKAARFRHQLVERGISAAAMARLCCPIGIAGLSSKKPEVIALSVAAQLMQLHEARAHQAVTTHPA